MNVEDIASKISKSALFAVYSMTEETKFLVHVSPGSAETLSRGGVIANKHLIAYSLSNICAKNYQNRFMCIKVIVCYISVVFFETQCTVA